MTPLACRYTIIQFAPFVETGEFANVGVVLTCPKTGYLDYRVQRRRYKRITDFFAGVERGHYTSAIDATIDELQYLKDMLTKERESQTAERLRHFFTSLVRPRETVIKYSPERVVLTADPEAELDRLFGHYVEHSFATKEYVETRINDHLRSLLNELPLKSPFKAEQLGSNDLHAQFHFVQSVDDKPVKLIKALNLSQKDPLSIGDHGDSWAGRMRRLERANPHEMPNQKLFAVQLAPREEVARHEVGMEVVRELERLGIQVVNHATATAVDEVAAFAMR